MIAKRLRRQMALNFSGVFRKKKKVSEILMPQELCFNLFIQWETRIFLNFINAICVKFRNTCNTALFPPLSSKNPLSVGICHFHSNEDYLLALPVM